MLHVLHSFTKRPLIYGIALSLSLSLTHTHNSSYNSKPNHSNNQLIHRCELSLRPWLPARHQRINKLNTFSRQNFLKILLKSYLFKSLRLDSRRFSVITQITLVTLSHNLSFKAPKVPCENPKNPNNSPNLNIRVYTHRCCDKLKIFMDRERHYLSYSLLITYLSP